MNTMNTKPIVQTYLNFDGRTEEAIEFYRRALGAELALLMRFKDSPEPPKAGCMPEGCENKVMHAQFRIGEHTLMASDCHCGNKPNFQGFSLSLTVPTEGEAERLFQALTDGGQVQLPMAQTFFSARFGVVTDRFGVSWMVLVTPGETPRASKPAKARGRLVHA